jgi:exodeoxyribonuclease V alpha subunit
MALTAEQQSFVDLVLHEQPRIAVLTGGPGTGKTTAIHTLITELRAQGRSFAVAAPSGKAAQRAEEALRGAATASTIHRLLQMLPEVAQHEPLTASVVVIDEASMIDVRLFSHLMRACFEGGGRVDTLVLVGDPDQLPPVGPGQPFLDLLSATTIRVPVVKLTQVHRQALESGIVRAAVAIRAGEEPEWCDDFRLVECEAIGDVPATIMAVADELGLEADSSQFLTPQKNTGGGCEAINLFVEQRRARPGDEKPLREKFRVGTKVINGKNDYTLGVFNGETGFVKDVRPGAKPAQDVVEVMLGAGRQQRPVLYRGGQINILGQAWALTVHRSQGSEYRDVVLVAHPGHSFMLSRSLLYVACTRARERVVVVGQKAAVARAVRKVDDTSRTTLLQRWLGCPKRTSA